MERQAISFGGPKTFEEAIYCLPARDHPLYKQDDEIWGLVGLRNNLENIFGLLKPSTSVRDRIIEHVTSGEMKLMEELSFKRSVVDQESFLWDDSIKVYRSRIFDMIPTEELVRKVTVSKMEPHLGEDFEDYVFVCIEFKPDGLSRDRTQFLLAILDEVEYEILIGADSS